MRLTVFWDRMNLQFGEAYAASVAQDYVLAGIGGRTVNQALADGEDVKAIWQAVCDAFDVPGNLHLFRTPLVISQLPWLTDLVSPPPGWF